MRPHASIDISVRSCYSEAAEKFLLPFSCHNQISSFANPLNNKIKIQSHPHSFLVQDFDQRQQYRLSECLFDYLATGK